MSHLAVSSRLQRSQTSWGRLGSSYWDRGRLQPNTVSSTAWWAHSKSWGNACIVWLIINANIFPYLLFFINIIQYWSLYILRVTIYLEKQNNHHFLVPNIKINLRNKDLKYIISQLKCKYYECFPLFTAILLNSHDEGNTLPFPIFSPGMVGEVCLTDRQKA